MASANHRLSLEECRCLLGAAAADRSGDEVLALRDHLYNLSELVVSLIPDSLQRESIEERAAILEFDAGIPRPIAEFDAMLSRSKSRR